MNKIDLTTIDELCQPQSTHVLSIYTPTHQMSTPATIKEDQLRLKHLLAQGIEQLCKSEPDMSVTSIRTRLDEAIENEDAWQEASKTIAMFTDGSYVKILHLPIECSEYVHIGKSYDTAPLQLTLEMNQPFYVFALAKHDPKLFRGDLYGLQQMGIDFPSSPEEALQIDEMFNNSNTVRAFGSGKGGNDMLSTHGQGDSNHAGQEERLMYFRILEHMILSSSEYDASVPMIIAAAQSEASDFKNMSKISNLLDTYISGNHTATQPHQLHAEAWHIISRQILGQKITQAIAQFNELKGMQKGSSDPDDILEAAKAGRVDTLLVGILETTNDSVEDGAYTKEWIIRLNTAYRSRIADLVGAIKAQGGKIIGVDTAILATPTHVAAVYRY